LVATLFAIVVKLSALLHSSSIDSVNTFTELLSVQFASFYQTLIPHSFLTSARVSYSNVRVVVLN